MASSAPSGPTEGSGCAGTGEALGGDALSQRFGCRRRLLSFPERLQPEVPPPGARRQASCPPGVSAAPLPAVRSSSCRPSGPAGSSVSGPGGAPRATGGAIPRPSRGRGAGRVQDGGRALWRRRARMETAATRGTAGLRRLRGRFAPPAPCAPQPPPAAYSPQPAPRLAASTAARDWPCWSRPPMGRGDVGQRGKGTSALGSGSPV